MAGFPLREAALGEAEDPQEGGEVVGEEVPHQEGVGVVGEGEEILGQRKGRVPLGLQVRVLRGPKHRQLSGKRRSRRINERRKYIE